MLNNYKNLHPDVEVVETKQKGESISGIWSDLEDKAMYLNSEVD